MSDETDVFGNKILIGSKTPSSGGERGSTAAAPVSTSLLMGFNTFGPNVSATFGTPSRGGFGTNATSFGPYSFGGPNVAAASPSSHGASTYALSANNQQSFLASSPGALQRFSATGPSLGAQGTLFGSRSADDSKSAAREFSRNSARTPFLISSFSTPPPHFLTSKDSRNSDHLNTQNHVSFGTKATAGLVHAATISMCAVPVVMHHTRLSTVHSFRV